MEKFALKEFLEEKNTFEWAYHTSGTLRDLAPNIISITINKNKKLTSNFDE